MVDEMDLLSGMKAAEPLRPRAFEDARAVLRAAIALEGLPETKTAVPRQARWGLRGKAGFGVAGLVAAAAAAALIVTSASAPRPATPAVSASQAPGGSASRAPAASSPLVTLAALITAGSGSLPGNASLVIRTQTEGGIPPQVSYNLYTDGRALYVGGDKSSLTQAVTRHQNMADGMTASEVKVAVYAAAGNLAYARQLMSAVSPGDRWLSLTGAARQAAWDKAIAQELPALKAKGMTTRPALPAGKALRSIIDNRVWNNSVDALSAGAGNPQVRAGVLRLLSTISGVTVASSTTGGQHTLTLTAGPEVFGGSGRQILTVNARTGMPVRSVFPASGKVPASVQTFKVSRVTLAAVEAGKF